MPRKTNPKSLANLKKPWQKGVCGNPNGRPKELPKLARLLRDVLGEEKDGVTAAEAILKALRAKAAKGDIRAAEILLDRAYGKPNAKLDITTDGEKIGTNIDLSKLPSDVLAALIAAHNPDGESTES